MENSHYPTVLLYWKGWAWKEVVYAHRFLFLSGTELDLITVS